MSRELQLTEAPRASVARQRLESVDLLRGLVIVLMALDHTRDFFSNAPFAPLDLQHTSPALFITRWITHLCAPTFIFLAGVGAFLAMNRGKSRRELSLFLVTRGLWLVLLELTWVNWFAWSFHLHFRSFGLQVIWVIGFSMVVLAGLVWLPRWATLTFALVLIFGHNALDGLTPERFGAWADVWRVLHVSGELTSSGDIRVGVGYPLIPWVAVMALGFAMGPLLVREKSVRRRQLMVCGVALLALFIVIRAVNIYGDLVPWSRQKNALFTLFSFLNCNKYPPSLDYLLMTLGPCLLLLAWFDRGTPTLLKPLLTFGRVPLFFYLLHLPFIQALDLLITFLRFGKHPPEHAGFGLAGVYGFWILILLLFYPACRWFAKFKSNNPQREWLSYL